MHIYSCHSVHSVNTVLNTLSSGHPSEAWARDPQVLHAPGRAFSQSTTSGLHPVAHRCKDTSDGALEDPGTGAVCSTGASGWSMTASGSCSGSPKSITSTGSSPRSWIGWCSSGWFCGDLGPVLRPVLSAGYQVLILHRAANQSW
jgi:hypothetical protein